MYGVVNALTEAEHVADAAQAMKDFWLQAYKKFVVGNYYRLEITDDKDIKSQTNEYQWLLEELKAEKINLPDKFVAGT
ncbi:Retrovirus-related Pol polyprotein from transposon TNT 1-94 [Senna tora]|uniref:Retrovirus-related Pol polyprotein from transposon TNT 1-94 n=1 Tax=Senna tora TaxID=362788 RepID=A0A834T319_9FABA|nr:Retrovirus-related Pol polyprotein from transposon TNT 1-94 [Senna tora]